MTFFQTVLEFVDYFFPAVILIGMLVGAIIWHHKFTKRVERATVPACELLTLALNMMVTKDDVEIERASKIAPDICRSTKDNWTKIKQIAFQDFIAVDEIYSIYIYHSQAYVTLYAFKNEALHQDLYKTYEVVDLLNVEDCVEVFVANVK